MFAKACRVTSSRKCPNFIAVVDTTSGKLAVFSSRAANCSRARCYFFTRWVPTTIIRTRCQLYVRKRVITMCDGGTGSVVSDEEV